MKEDPGSPLSHFSSLWILWTIRFFVTPNRPRDRPSSLADLVSPLPQTQLSSLSFFLSRVISSTMAS